MASSFSSATSVTTVSSPTSCAIWSRAAFPWWASSPSATNWSAFSRSHAKGRRVTLAPKKLLRFLGDWDTVNPIWARELRQSARLARVPIGLMTAVGLLSLVMCGIGATMGAFREPAAVGRTLFDTFSRSRISSSAWSGRPSRPAPSLPSTSGIRWETLLLTGMSSAQIAQGKFASAFSTMLVYVIGLAPLGALPFLFGGVSATEVVIAFVFLLLIALVTTAFGLAISSRMARVGTATVLTLLVTVVLSPALYLSAGSGLSFAAHAAWPQVVSGWPIRLPGAYEVAPFGFSYLVFLVILPILAFALPAWYFYEITIANLMNVTDDRSFRVKRWYLFSAPAIAGSIVAVGALVGDSSRAEYLLGGVFAFFAFLLFVAFVFVGEPIGPSRRVARRLRPRKTRPPAALLGTRPLAHVHARAHHRGGRPRCDRRGGRVAHRPHIGAGRMGHQGGRALGLHGILDRLLRVRRRLLGLAASAPRAAVRGAHHLGSHRVLRGGRAVAFGLDRGCRAKNQDTGIIFAAPSPLYAFTWCPCSRRATPCNRFTRARPCTVFWALLGLGLLATAAHRSSRILSEHERALAHAEAILAGAP